MRCPRHEQLGQSLEGTNREGLAPGAGQPAIANSPTLQPHRCSAATRRRADLRWRLPLLSLDPQTSN